MTTTVVPETFHLVNYEAPVIAALAERLANDAGIGDLDLRIEVEETNPFARAQLLSVDGPITIKVEGGGLEDRKRPKQYSEATAATTIGIALYQAADRRTEGFAAAPGDTELTNEQRVAWEVTAAGRLTRKGWPIHRPRLEYHFRIRYGFTDDADAAFQRLWDTDAPTWADIEGVTTPSA